MNSQAIIQCHREEERLIRNPKMDQYKEEEKGRNKRIKRRGYDIVIGV